MSEQQPGRAHGIAGGAVPTDEQLARVISALQGRQDLLATLAGLNVDVLSAVVRIAGSGVRPAAMVPVFAALSRRDTLPTVPPVVPAAPTRTLYADVLKKDGAALQRYGLTAADCEDLDLIRDRVNAWLQASGKLASCTVLRTDPRNPSRTRTPLPDEPPYRYDDADLSRLRIANATALARIGSYAPTVEQRADGAFTTASGGTVWFARSKKIVAMCARVAVVNRDDPVLQPFTVAAPVVPPPDPPVSRHAEEAETPPPAVARAPSQGRTRRRTGVAETSASSSDVAE